MSLGAPDLVDELAERASRLPAVDLPADLRVRIASVVEKLGIDFLRRASKRHPANDGLPAWAHPIGEIIDVLSANHLGVLLELSEWFDALADVPGFPAALTVLRSSWETARMQLAAAHRLHSLGVLECLEPAADRRKIADLAFAVDGRRFLAECYVPEEKDGTTSRRFFREVDAIFDAASDHVFTRIDILFARSIEHKDCRRLRHIIVKELAAKKPRELLVDDAAEVYIRRVPRSEAEPLLVAPTPKDDGSHDWGAAKNLARKSDLNLLRSGVAIPKIPVVVLLVRNAPSESVEIAEEARTEFLVEKLAKKFYQTKGSAEEGRVLMATVPELAWKSSRSARILDVLERRLKGKRQGFAALVLATDRQETNPPRVEWKWRVTFANEVRALLGPIFDKF